MKETMPRTPPFGRVDDPERCLRVGTQGCAMGDTVGQDHGVRGAIIGRRVVASGERIEAYEHGMVARVPAAFGAVFEFKLFR